MQKDNTKNPNQVHSVLINIGIVIINVLVIQLVTLRLGYFTYCKSGNIRGTLIFAYFAQIQQARIQKPAKIFAIFCMHILDA